MDNGIEQFSADTVTFNDPGECAVTETVNGGASSTTYDCEGSAPVDEPGFERPAGHLGDFGRSTQKQLHLVILAIIDQ